MSCLLACCKSCCLRSSCCLIWCSSTRTSSDPCCKLLTIRCNLASLSAACSNAAALLCYRWWQCWWHLQQSRPAPLHNSAALCLSGARVQLSVAVRYPIASPVGLSHTAPHTKTWRDSQQSVVPLPAAAAVGLAGCVHCLSTAQSGAHSLLPPPVTQALTRSFYSFTHPEIFKQTRRPLCFPCPQVRLACSISCCALPLLQLLLEH